MELECLSQWLLIFTPADIYKVWRLMSQADDSVNSCWSNI